MASTTVINDGALDARLPEFLPSDRCPVVAAWDSDTVESVLRTLHDRNFLSVPVKTADERVVGMVSLLDLLTYLLFSAESSESHAKLTMDEKFNTPISRLASTAEACGYFNTTDCLRDVLEPFGSGIHRVLIYESDTKGFKLISQTDVLRYLWRHPDSLRQDIVRASIDTLRIGSTNVKIARDDYSARDAFNTLAMEEKTSLAILSADGTLIGNVSLSDVRGIGRDDFAALMDLPLLDFLKARNGGALREVVKCTAAATLWEAVERMLAARVHRVWIVDDAGAPTAQVSMSDIIRLLVLPHAVIP